MSVELLPDSRLKDARSHTGHPKGAFQQAPGWWWTPIFCANCGADGGAVPEDNIMGAFYLCPPCFETHGVPAGISVMPDEVFWQLVHNEMMERYGRMLTTPEILTQLADTNSLLSRLARDRTALTPSPRG